MTAALQRRKFRHGCGDRSGLTVSRCPQRVGGLGFVEPKSCAGQRTIALPRQLLPALKIHRERQQAEREAAGSLWQEHDLVFAQPDGRPIGARADWQEWKELLAAAGVRTPACTTPATPPRPCCFSKDCRRG